MRLKKPELLVPVFPNPDTVPAPELKKPDDGTVVVFPKPGAAGMSMIGIVIGPRPPVPVMSIRGPGLVPMLIAIAGRAIEMLGKLIALSLTTPEMPAPKMVMSTVTAGIWKPSIVTTPSVPVIGISR
ncbi:hypothetical protein H7H53_02190 [Mycobacterium lacus]|uniref:hypothetical protein n=1 Tax=Mycobacterium lacus TaxID=169765 RepID=UPI00355730C0|nr:hypothetical protein [Mycobacterium lacus]